MSVFIIHIYNHMINHNENEDGNEKIDHIGLDMNPNSKYKSVPA